MLLTLVLCLLIGDDPTPEKIKRNNRKIPKQPRKGFETSSTRSGISLPIPPKDRGDDSQPLSPNRGEHGVLALRLRCRFE